MNGPCIFCVRSSGHISYSYSEVSILCVHWSSRKATTVSQFDSKEIYSKWAHPSAEACGDKGMMRRGRVSRKMKRDSGVERGPSIGRTARRSLTVKYDGCGISTLSHTFSCPLDVAAWRFFAMAWSLSISSIAFLYLKKAMTFRGEAFLILTTNGSAFTLWNSVFCWCDGVKTP